MMLLPAVMLALAAGAPLLPAAPASGALRWGHVGHRAIAMVAAERLTPAARDEVARLLEGGTLADASTWPDSIRRDRPATAPWHYVNVSILDSVYRPERHCPNRCVIEAYQRQLAILGDRARPAGDRADALRWVVHLLEDLHQPLHVGDRGDRGGSDVQLTFAGRRMSLHSLWDGGLIDAMDYTDRSLADQITAITDWIGDNGDLDQLAGGDVVDWAMESHDLARRLVYPMLPASLAVDRDYLAVVMPSLQFQLVRASVRLAAVLNRTLGQD